MSIYMVLWKIDMVRHFLNDIRSMVNKVKSVGALDFSEAFDLEPHISLLTGMIPNPHSTS